MFYVDYLISLTH